MIGSDEPVLQAEGISRTPMLAFDEVSKSFVHLGNYH